MNPAGGKVIVLTDGQENQNPRVRDVADEVLTKVSC